MKRPLVVLVLLLAAHLAIVLRHHARPLITDEIYYYEKARSFAAHGSFPHASAEELRIVQGSVWGTSDWRPPGYSLFLAIIGTGDPAGLRLRLTIIQFLLVAAVLLWTAQAGPSLSMPVAMLLALAPWPFEFANDIGPDALNAALTGTALLLAWRWATTPDRGPLALFLAMLAASATLLLRPEMIAMAPVIAIAALLLRRRPVSRDIFAALLAFALVVGLQAAYRTVFTGRIGLFGALRIKNAGAFNWTRTWFGTEKEAYDFVYAVTEGRREELPARAFSNERERALVESLVQAAVAGGYSERIDRAFQALADQRRAAHPLRTYLIRASNIVQLWINLETNSAILEALAPIPRGIRRPILGALLLLRIVIVILSFACARRAWKRWREGEAGAHEILVLMMFSYVAARTLLVGIVLDWRVHRYVISAWVPMLACAAYALSPTPARPTPSNGPEVFAGAAPAADGGAASA